MIEALLHALNGLGAGVANLHWSHPIMIALGGALLYLGIKKAVEPLLLVPIGFGAILVNIPLADLMGEEGFLRTIYNMGDLPTVPASRTAKILFPIVVTVAGGLVAPMGRPLLGSIMLGNLMKESGAVQRLTKASENEIANVVTLLLGLSIGATMSGPLFKFNYLLMHAVGANTGGQVGSVMAAAIMLSVLKGLDLIP